MSRVRGAEAYRLLITRTSPIDTVCGFLGIEKAALLAANPMLLSDELSEGTELHIPAALLEPPGGEVELDTAATAEAASSHGAPEDTVPEAVASGESAEQPEVEGSWTGEEASEATEELTASHAEQEPIAEQSPVIV